MSQVAIDDATIERLQSAVAGDVVTPEDPSYEEARRVWNGMIDCHPALIVRCATTQDVAAAVNFGRDNDLTISVRGGAHSTPGYSTCNGGIVIDVQPMNRVEVDAGAKTARVGGGARWADVDAATQEHGLAVTGGRVSTTGVAGLALGSGSGWLERVYGVTCASLRSAEVVVSDGSLVKASADENADLFWGLRGGGGNFGVVTEFEFNLHPVGPILTGGMLLFPRARASEIVRLYRDFIAAAPDQVCGGLAFITAPPEEFVPEDMRGKPAVGITYCYVGPPEEGEEAVRPLREAGPVVDMIQPMPYTAIQQMLDDGQPVRDSRVLQGRVASRPDGRGDRHHHRAGREPARTVRRADPRADGRRRQQDGRERARAQRPGRALGIFLPRDVDGSRPRTSATSPGYGASPTRCGPSASARRPTRTSLGRTRVTRGCARPTGRRSTPASSR